MLNRLKSLFIPKTKANSTSTPDKRLIPFKDHQISKSQISRAASKVISGLTDSGYEAYLVGGGVRDLLLGDKPKDFDVATSATPEQIRRVFRQARIIGRRFQIVHVRFGREIIEVTTFRGSHATNSSSQTTTNQKNKSLSSDKGILLRDNVYGDLESDALRRDFTVNALYYDYNSEEIIDFTNGMADLKQRRLCIIGDAQTRYKEDPVRMLRAVRFSSKLGFELDRDTESAVYKNADLLSEIPAARLFEEVLKLFMSGHASACLHQLRQFDLLKHLFPGLADSLQSGSEFDSNFVEFAASNTDKRIRRGKSVTPAFIYAAMLWPPLQSALSGLRASAKTQSFSDCLYQASQGVISQQLSVTSIPKRFLIPMREIWNLQYRFDKRSGKRAFALLENSRFRAAYDFLLLREQAGEKTNNLGDWWTRFQRLDAEEQEKMILELGPSKKPRRRRRRRPARQNSNSSDEQFDNSSRPDAD